MRLLILNVLIKIIDFVWILLPEICFLTLAEYKKSSIFATLLEKGITIRIHIRAFSSAGSEHLPYKQRVGGSNPSTPTSNSISNKHKHFGRLAQLVQSICLTSRGSGVRIPQRPPTLKVVHSVVRPFFLLRLMFVTYILSSS
jgi:hypothetical protein